MPRGNPDNLRDAARRKSAQTTERAEAALRDMLKRGERITFRGLARKAGCSEDFLYSHAELRSRIEQLRGRQRTTPPPPRSRDEQATSNVARALTAQLSELRRRHHREVGELREALAAAHGELLELRRQLASTPDSAPGPKVQARESGRIERRFAGERASRPATCSMNAGGPPSSYGAYP